MTIDEVHQNLEFWRKNKKSPRDRIPREYWDAVIKLTAAHSISQLSSKLGLNSNEIKRRMGHLVKSEQMLVFKELPSVAVQKPESIPIFELTTSSGLTLRVYQ